MDGRVGMPVGARIRDEDVDALVAAMFSAHARSLVRLADMFVADRMSAEDMVQEAFIRLAGAATRIDDPAKAAAYLRSIVLNLCRDHNRRGLVLLHYRHPGASPAASVDEEVVFRDDQRSLIDALARLPTRQRDALVLRYWMDLPYAQIAMTLGISVNSVKTHLRRGMKGLERDLKAGS